jgi:hypothetical protein
MFKVVFCILVYFAAVSCFQIFIADNFEDHIKYWYCSLFLPGFNFIAILLVGKYILSCMLYPYQNLIFGETQDIGNNYRFGEEFTHSLECLVYTIKCQAGLVTHRGTTQQSLKSSPRSKKTIKEKQK